MDAFAVLISMVSPGKRYAIGKECVFNHFKNSLSLCFSLSF